MTTTALKMGPSPLDAIDADQERRRKPLRRLAEWMANPVGPVELFTDQVVAAAFTVTVGHDVPVEQGAAVMQALAARDALIEGPSSDHFLADFGAAMRAIDTALDDILDLTRCVACGDVIEGDSTHLDCNEVGETFCEWQCHDAFHMGARCNGGSYR